MSQESATAQAIQFWELMERAQKRSSISGGIDGRPAPAT